MTATQLTAANTSVGVRELRNHLSAYLERVKAGEEITVTDHGRPIALLTPQPSTEDRMATLVEAGVVRPPAHPKQRDIPPVRLKPAKPTIDELVAEERWVPPARVQLTGPGPSLSEVVIEQRG